MTQESLRSIPPLLGNDRGQFKIHVIGNSGEPCHYASLTGFILETGAGKACTAWHDEQCLWRFSQSTLSAQLSELLNIPVISLDKLFWRPNWVKAPDEEFRNSVRDGINQDTRGWIIDGNYSSILGAHISEEATDIICLYLFFWSCPVLILVYLQGSIRRYCSTSPVFFWGQWLVYLDSFLIAAPDVQKRSVNVFSRKAAFCCGAWRIIPLFENGVGNWCKNTVLVLDIVPMNKRWEGLVDGVASFGGGLRISGWLSVQNVRY